MGKKLKEYKKLIKDDLHLIIIVGCLVVLLVCDILITIGVITWLRRNRDNWVKRI